MGTGVTRQEILMVVLGGIEIPAGLDLGDNRNIEYVLAIELRDIVVSAPAGDFWEKLPNDIVFRHRGPGG